MKKLNKKIAIISGSRGDYDLLKPIIKKMYKIKSLGVYTIITGSHLINIYGNNKLFLQDGIKINKKIKINYSNDNTTSILNYMSDGIKNLIDIFQN